MNATKWTAGPWQIGSDFTTLAGDRKTTLWGSDGNQAVTLIQSGLVKWEEQADANANLIAAAPELYAALQTMIDYMLESHAGELESCHEGDAEMAGEAPEACSYCQAIADARAALAKARGES
jgi:hypothetical protein